jgi:hypothetical protein
MAAMMLFSDGAMGVAVADSGDAYCTGHFSDTVDFDPGSGNDDHSSNGHYDVFISKIDSAGDFQWAATWGSTVYDVGYGVAADSAGNACIIGDFEYMVDFDPGGGTYYLTSNGSSDIFLSKISSDGVLQWARNWGGQGGDTGRGIDAEPWGNIYLTGHYMLTVDFDPGPGVDNQSSNGNDDIFLLKVLPDGYW